MSEQAIIDTSVYLRHFREGLHKRDLQEAGFLIRNSAVVLAELHRGCLTDEERAVVGELEDTFPIITPTEKIWLESGRILSRFSRSKGYTPDKLRDLHFDVLIALSARYTGAVVITLNERDFEEIRSMRDFKLVCWK